MPVSLESVDNDLKGNQKPRGGAVSQEGLSQSRPMGRRDRLSHTWELNWTLSELETFAERWVLVFRIYLEQLTMACMWRKRSGLLSLVPSPSVPLSRACTVHRLETSPYLMSTF